MTQQKQRGDIRRKETRGKLFVIHSRLLVHDSGTETENFNQVFSRHYFKSSTGPDQVTPVRFWNIASSFILRCTKANSYIITHT